MRPWAVVIAVMALNALAACGGGASPGSPVTSAVTALPSSTAMIATSTTSSATTLAPTTSVPLDDPFADLPPGEASLSAPAAVAEPEVVDPRQSTAPTEGLLLRYVVIPHPDDEFEAWSLLSGDTRHYTVFLLMTRGESSHFCDGSGIGSGPGSQAFLAERLPMPQPFQGEGANCATQRVNAWHAFLNDMAGADTVLDLPTPIGTLKGVDPPVGAAPSYEMWTGPRTARLVFDLGDGNLTPEEVIWAVDTARSLRGTRLPDLPEDDLIAAAYYNASYPGSIVYTHPDHRAVQVALYTHDFGTPGAQIGRTAAADPDRVLRFAVPPAVYCAAMCVQPGPIDPDTNPDARRSGFLQSNYGWLAEHYWAGALEPSGSIFSQQQDFWAVH